MTSRASGTGEAGVVEPGHAGIFRTLRDMPRSVRFALLGVFINAFGAFLQAFMVLYLVDHRDFSETQAGLALGAYAAGAIVGVVSGGGMTDRLGPRWTIVLAVGAASLMTFSVTLLASFMAIMVAVAMAGAMTTASRPAVMALLFKSVPPARQVMAQAMYRTVLSVGAVAGPVTAAWLSTIHWNLVFYFDASASLIYCAIALFLLPKGRGELDIEPAAGSAGKDTSKDTSKDAEVAGSATSAGEPPQPAKAGYLTLIRDYRYLGYLALMLANGIVHVQFIAVLPLMLKDENYPTAVYGWALSLSAAMIIVCELLVTKTTQKWPLWVAILTGWVLLVIGRGMFGMVGLIGGVSIVMIATMFGVFGQIIGGPAAFAYPARVAPDAAMGRYIGAAHGMFQVGSAIGPFIGILLWRDLGLGRSFWGVIMVFGLVMVAVGVWAMRPTGHGRDLTADPPDTTGPGQDEATRTNHADEADEGQPGHDTDRDDTGPQEQATVRSPT